MFSRREAERDSQLREASRRAWILAAGAAVTLLAAIAGSTPVLALDHPSAAGATAPGVPSNPKDRLLSQAVSRAGSSKAPSRFVSSITCNSNWNAVSSPNMGTSALASISGVAANDMWAVGLFINGSNVAQTLAEHWDGSAWTIVSTPNTGAGNNVLESVTAIASNDAWAVGYSRPDNNSARQSLTEHWNGTSWSVVSNPQAAGSNTLFAVSAASGGDVWAVGVTGTSTSIQISASTLAMHWNGTSWALVTVSPSAHDVDVLSGIRALASNNVWAVGYQQNFTGTSPFPATALIEHWNGSGWTQATQALDPPGGDFLNDVAGSGLDLWAVGGAVVGSNQDAVLTEHSIDGGATWNAVAATSPDMSADLYGLAYISSTNVYAVGLSAYSMPFTNQEQDHTLIEKWNGSSWAVVTSPNPSASDGLTVAAAISADDVWAEGFSSGQTLTVNLCTPPTVTNVAPNTGPAVGGTSVVITGTGFTGAVAVDFGTTAASTFHVDSDTQITVTSPPHPGGVVDVTVTVQGTSATSAADQFTYVAPTPIVTNVNPGTGPTAGGTPVTITGTGLLFATSVKFGTVPAASITSNTDTTIVAVSPAEPKSTVDITVTTAGGTSATSVADQFGFVAPVPTVTSVVPAGGSPSGGTSVTINGTGLSFATSVMFGTTPAAGITSNTDTQIVATSPPGTIGTTVDVTVTTAGGTSATSAADHFTYLQSCYFNWYDNASGGVVGDNIHLLNTSGATAHMTVSMPGAPTINVTLAAGGETYVKFAAGSIGGPVQIQSDQSFVASQRVQYYSTFNEIWCEKPAQAATTLYFQWYDKASAGFLNDNIHVLNTSGSTAHVSVTVGGGSPVMATVAAGSETYVTFPFGTVGGPVVVTSDVAVLASQRVQFNQSFNEVWGETASQAATVSFINWYDKASAGFLNDNIHLLNPGGAPASVTVSIPGAPDQMTVVPAGGETYVTFPHGTIGGPIKITVTAGPAVLASQRVQFQQTFNEVWAETAAQAAAVSHVMWFDNVSAGFVNDHIHLLNPGVAPASVTVSIPGAADQMTVVPAGGETYVTFPAGTIGGPVTITVTSGPGVLAAQRVQYYSSFNEVWAM